MPVSLRNTVAGMGQKLNKNWNIVHIDKRASYLEKLHIQPENQKKVY